MARSNESSNATSGALPDQQGWRHWGDGLFGKILATRLQGFYPTAADYRDVQVDVNGVLQTSSGAGGGGAATIADGADVAQGTTTDTSAASTVVGILKAIKASLAGTLTTTTSWAAAQHVIVDTAPTTPVTGTFWQGTQPVSLASAPTTPVTGTFFQATQPVSAAALPLPAGAATDANISAALGTPTSDSPGAYTVLDQLVKIRKLVDQEQQAMKALLALSQPKAVVRVQPTLLHRS